MNNNNFFVTVVVCNNAFHNYAIITKNAAFENERAAKVCLYGTLDVLREEIPSANKVIIAEMKDAQKRVILNIVCEYNKITVQAVNPELLVSQ